MVENGLLQEIQQLREVAVKMYGSVDATDHAEGIFQSIGGHPKWRVLLT